MNDSTEEQLDVTDPTDAPDVGRVALHDVSSRRMLVVVAQVLVAIGALAIVVVSPGDVRVLIARLTGVVVVAVGMVMVRQVLAGHRNRGDAKRPESGVTSARLVGCAVVIAAGVLLVVNPDRFLRPLGWLAGALAAGAGVHLIWSVRADRTARGPFVWRGLLLIVGGIAFALSATAIFTVLAIGFIVIVVATGAVRAGVQADLVDLDLTEPSTRPVLVRWIDSKGVRPQRRDAIYEQVFFEGSTAPQRIGRFLLMMFFASVISAAGVLADSTAVVIGAMLVAPLISPMMGMGLSLATGWPNRLARSALVVLAGIAIAVGTGFLLAATGLTTDLVANSQITSRSSPSVVDLIIAVAAGAAGAYALSRKDVSSSLPGVAVAIALVPPLSVVGITAEGGDWDQATGTLLLFLTNLVAIILAGGAVFILTGIAPLQRFAENQYRVRTALSAVGVLALLVVGGLVVNGRQIAEDALDQEVARQVVADWLGDDTEFAVVSIDVDGEAVAVILAGPGDPPGADPLANELAARFDDDVVLNLQWIPRNQVIISADG